MWLEGVRKRIPFGYWLFYDCVVLTFEIYAFGHLSHWYAISLLFLGFAVVFDVVEAIVKTFHLNAEATPSYSPSSPATADQPVSS